LSGIKASVHWHDSIDDVPDGPALIFANEYFDALPINQAVFARSGWHERVVTVNDKDQLVFATAPEPLPRFDLLLNDLVRAAPIGAIFEWRSPHEIMKLARRLRQFGGAALIIDYGHSRSDAGDTFQAIARHSFADPLKNPGQSDLTAHVDFEALARSAEDVDARVHGPIEQGQFLRRLGIETRAATLVSKANTQVAADVTTALRRLVGNGRGGMGSLFKVLGLSHPSIETLAGFVEDTLTTKTTDDA
jgi:SAM-dependent MidA family methyltransferase